MPSRPLMFLVGGPAGSGKSTAFPVSETGFPHFSVDDRCAQLNGGSYQKISPRIRARAGAECEIFVETHIGNRKSFAVETTLRRETPFLQARSAKENGFVVSLLYLAIEWDWVVERVAIRADAGGHAAPPDVLLAIYDASLANLPRALREFDNVAAYDNSQTFAEPRLVLEGGAGRVSLVSPPRPKWLQRALQGTEFESALER